MGILTASPVKRHNAVTILALAPALCFLIIFFVYPIAKVLADTVFVDGQWDVSGYVQTFRNSAFLTIFGRTIVLSLAVTAICLALAYPLAHTLAQLKGPVAAIFLLMVAIPYITSVLVRTYGWIIILAPNGLINKALLSAGLIDKPMQLVFNMLGAYIGTVQVQLPLMVFPIYASMKRFDHTLLDAASNLGSNRLSAIWNVYLPLTRVGIISGCSLVFLSTLGFYTTPALLGGTSNYLLAQAITVRLSNLADFAGASTQAAILFAVTVVLMIVFRKWLTFHNEHQFDRLPAGRRNVARYKARLRDAGNRRLGPALDHLGATLSHLLRPLRWTVSIFVLACLVLPLLVVIPLAFSGSSYISFPPPSLSLRWFKTFFENSQWLEAARFSLVTCGAAVVVSIALSIPAAMAMVRRKMIGRETSYLFLIAPIVLPQVVTALALYLLFAQSGLVGTKAGFIVAYTIIGLPYAVIVLVAGIHQLDDSLEMAAANLGATPLAAFQTITLPLLLPSIASAAFFTFVMCFDDVVFGLYLGGPDAVPLSVRMWDDIKNEISPQVAVVATLVFGMMALAYVGYLTIPALLRKTIHRSKR
ncbi:MAG: ABC transporter permease subunit [Mesorhizobium sp.]|uniref:ABC transporter permease subunit n=2 Tax=Mesorhizobium TaxID=68287 RepID=UPI000FE696EC|nr:MULTISPECIES: ABC transporter permease subunit [unclassified Mesorhizobium]RWE36064.1 MAG: ABC transporter permease subunit [Mesorhizobium sp.]TGP87865.1 ABC transporter permease subunit [Mesorhizobium sp. M8A.F.Ca.ET.218.01.1.1]TGT15663.1 ABC transporter permease subunit [Mesorhizobium sp. M8A.F.Ca.ET.213.01.1.1]